MQEQTFYNTIESGAVTEYKDRGSRFIAYAYPIFSIEDFKVKMNELKKEHPKATHHCFAYRLGLDGNNYRVSDAGEPSGTAGKPILAQIDSKELTDILVVVLRYFGGTLLGVPGLINAYKSSTALVLQLTPIIHKQVENVYQLQFDYTNMNDVMTIVKQYNCNILSQDLQLFCLIRLGVPISREEEVLYKFGEIRNLEIRKQRLSAS